jgi:hypothetical protein
MYFLYLCENITIKPVEIVLRRGMRENDGAHEFNLSRL